jgi:bla regulator protein blaR1
LLAIAVGAGVLACFVDTPRIFAHSGANSDWEKAAGGKMAFDVASVKKNAGSNNGSDSNMPFFGEYYRPNGGLFSATNYSLSEYIAFAYKRDRTQARMLDSELPKWAVTDHFDIQARAPAGTTKDQMRLMMQSLLADRFQLKAHFETRDTKVYLLEFVKPGVKGPKLQPHQDIPPCADASAPWTSNGELIVTPAGFPMRCNSPVGFVNPKGASYGGRNLAMQAIADSLVIAPNNPQIDRPVIDQTGLTGQFDFILNYWPQWNITSPQPDSAGPSMFEALKEQLGLKLEEATVPMEILVVDHIEEPSAN